jgi:hypothetical protein
MVFSTFVVIAAPAKEVATIGPRWNASDDYALPGAADVKPPTGVPTRHSACDAPVNLASS